MALIKADRVKETSTSETTANFILGSAATGYRTFASVCAVGDTFHYAIVNQSNGEWEVGIGTYGLTNTLERTTVLSSSNSNAKVNFSAGTKEVFLTASAQYMERIVDNGLLTSTGSSTSIVAVNDGPQPQLDLAFSADKTLTARYGPTPSYSRASTGTYYNASGVLTSAAINAPRFDHAFENGAWISKGLLIEEQRTNLCLQSNVTNTTWTSYRATCTTNSISSPDGTINASLIVDDSFNDVHYHRQTFSISSGTYTASVYAKAKEKYIVSFGGTSTGRKYFNLQNGTVGSNAFGSPVSASITPVGNGWYRLSVTGPSYAGGSGEHIQLILTNNIENEIYSGNGTSGAYFWGAQFEAGNFSTSYIPTTTSSVVRSADVCQITGSDFSGLWNSTEGSFVLEQDLLSYSDPAADQRYFAIAGGANNPDITLHYDGGSTFYIENYNVGLGSSLVLSDVSSKYKLAYGVKSGVSGGSGASLNGGPVVSATGTYNGATTLAKLDIGYQVGAAARSSWVQRIRYFNTRLDNQTLVQLSGGINNLSYKSITGSGSATVANGYTAITIGFDNLLRPATYADSAAPSNSVYYSSTASKLVYKDAAGNVNNLY